MTIVITVLFAMFFVWFITTFQRFSGTVLAGAVGYFCFKWGLNFVSSENFVTVQIYGWIFMALAGWMAIIVLSVIYEIVDNIHLALTP